MLLKRVCLLKEMLCIESRLLPTIFWTQLHVLDKIICETELTNHNFVYVIHLIVYFD